MIYMISESITPAVRKLLHACYDKSYGEMAELLQFTRRYFQQIRSGKELSIENEERILIKARNIDLDSGFADCTELSLAYRGYLLRASTISDVHKDAQQIKRLLEIRKHSKDSGLHHLYAHSLFTIWLHTKLTYDEHQDDDICKINMSDLIDACKHWKEAFKYTSSSFVGYYYEHNITTAQFLIAVFNDQTKSGKSLYNRDGDPRNHASIEYFNAFKTSAKKTNNLHAWRDAVEMAVYMNIPNLIEESLKGYIHCMNGKALSDVGKSIAYDILKSIDNQDVLEGYDQFNSLTLYIGKSS